MKFLANENFPFPSIKFLREKGFEVISISEELSGMLNSSLDKALSSMLDQFMIHIEDVVRTSIADELQKQLAPFKRPVPTNNS